MASPRLGFDKERNNKHLNDRTRQRTGSSGGAVIGTHLIESNGGAHIGRM